VVVCLCLCAVRAWGEPVTYLLARERVCSRVVSAPTLHSNVEPNPTLPLSCARAGAAASAAAIAKPLLALEPAEASAPERVQRKTDRMTKADMLQIVLSGVCLHACTTPPPHPPAPYACPPVSPSRSRCWCRALSPPPSPPCSPPPPPLTESPELVGLLSELQTRVAQLRDTTIPVLTGLAAGSVQPSTAAAFVDLKHQLTVAYVNHVLFYLLLKAEGRSVKDHPVMQQLLHIRCVQWGGGCLLRAGRGCTLPCRGRSAVPCVSVRARLVV
jgi:hypothetical protein